MGVWRGTGQDGAASYARAPCTEEETRASLAVREDRARQALAEAAERVLILFGGEGPGTWRPGSWSRENPGQ